MDETAAIRAALGVAVRELRRRAGLTQEDLAARAGLHPTNVSAIERGHRDVRFSVVVRLARALGVSLAELTARIQLPDDGDPGPPGRR